MRVWRRLAHGSLVAPGSMRRRARFHTQFEPTRFSAEYLQRAYELIVPPVQREVRQGGDAAERRTTLATAGTHRPRKGTAA